MIILKNILFGLYNLFSTFLENFILKNKKIKNDKNKELLIKNGFQKIRLNEQFSIKFQDHEV